MAEGVPRGGEERLEDASLDLGRDSRPIVRHLENDLPPRGVVAGGDGEQHSSAAQTLQRAPNLGRKNHGDGDEQRGEGVL